MEISTAVLVSALLGTLLFIGAIILYFKFVKEPKWDEYPEGMMTPDLSVDKKRRRRLKVAAQDKKGPATPPNVK